MKKGIKRPFDPAGPFTTGQLAKMLSVSSRTVLKWCDSGTLKCYAMPIYKTGLRGGDRRVTREVLLAFIAEHGLPMPEQLNVTSKCNHNWVPAFDLNNEIECHVCSICKEEVQ